MDNHTKIILDNPEGDCVSSYASETYLNKLTAILMKICLKNYLTF